jgi:two-component system CheB/CheR fusion protein
MDNLLKNTQIGTVFLDSDLTIRKINELGSKLTNILATDIGRPLKHLAFPGMPDTFLDDVISVAETLKPVQQEWKHKSGDFYLKKILPYRTAENAINGVIIIFINITQLKDTQKNLLALTSRLESAMVMGEMAWWEWDYSTNTVITDQSKHEMLGYSKKEVGKGFEWWTGLVHPEDYNQNMQAMILHLQGKAQYYEAEYRIRHKEGHYLWFKDKGGIVKRNNDGKPVKVVGIVMNITNEVMQKAMLGREIESSRGRLDAATLKYDMLFRTLTQGIVFQDTEGFIIDANPAAEEILGTTVAQMKTRTSETPEWKAIHEDGSEFKGEEHPAMQCLKLNKIIRNVIMGVHNPVRGKYVWIKITAVPFPADKSNNPPFVYTIFDEVTEPEK